MDPTKDYLANPASPVSRQQPSLAGQIADYDRLGPYPYSQALDHYLPDWRQQADQPTLRRDGTERSGRDLVGYVDRRIEAELDDWENPAQAWEDAMEAAAARHFAQQRAQQRAQRRDARQRQRRRQEGTLRAQLRARKPLGPLDRANRDRGERER